MRGGRDEAHVAVGFAARLVVLADREQARVFALGAGVRLDRDARVAGDRFETFLEVGDEFAPAAGLGHRSERVDARELRPRDGFHLGCRVELHGARTERDHRAVEREVAVSEASQVAHHLGFGAHRVEDRVRHELRFTDQVDCLAVVAFACFACFTCCGNRVVSVGDQGLADGGDDGLDVLVGRGFVR